MASMVVVARGPVAIRKMVRCRWREGGTKIEPIQRCVGQTGASTYTGAPYILISDSPNWNNPIMQPADFAHSLYCTPQRMHGVQYVVCAVEMTAALLKFRWKWTLATVHLYRTTYALYACMYVCMYSTPYGCSVLPLKVISKLAVLCGANSPSHLSSSSVSRLRFC